jgi:hypothetical protein
MDLHPLEFRSSSVYWFYDFNLPPEFSMANYRSNKYVRYDNKYYTIEKGDIVFQRKRGGGATDWQPLMIHREFKHTLDRKKTKELREQLKPFIEYYNVMSDMVEDSYHWGNIIIRSLNDGDYKPTTAEEALELFKPSDNPPKAWLMMTEMLKRKTRRYDYQSRTESFDKSQAMYYLADDLFEIVKPCKSVEVELGKLSNDRYKAWYR